jgi:hypothetical protein
MKGRVCRVILRWVPKQILSPYSVEFMSPLGAGGGGCRRRHCEGRAPELGLLGNLQSAQADMWLDLTVSADGRKYSLVFQFVSGLAVRVEVSIIKFLQILDTDKTIRIT